jgi:hypothetical protein
MFSYGIKIIGLLVAYILSAKFGLALGREWICDFGLVAYRYVFCSSFSFWLSPLAAIMCGAFLINLWTGAPILVALGIALGNTLEAIMAFICSEKWQA